MRVGCAVLVAAILFLVAVRSVRTAHRVRDGLASGRCEFLVGTVENHRIGPKPGQMSFEIDGRRFFLDRADLGAQFGDLAGSGSPIVPGLCVRMTLCGILQRIERGSDAACVPP